MGGGGGRDGGKGEQVIAAIFISALFPLAGANSFPYTVDHSLEEFLPGRQTRSQKVHVVSII